MDCMCVFEGVVILVNIELGQVLIVSLFSNNVYNDDIELLFEIRIELIIL